MRTYTETDSAYAQQQTNSAAPPQITAATGQTSTEETPSKKATPAKSAATTAAEAMQGPTGATASPPGGQNDWVCRETCGLPHAGLAATSSLNSVVSRYGGAAHTCELFPLHIHRSAFGRPP